MSWQVCDVDNVCLHGGESGMASETVVLLWTTSERKVDRVKKKKRIQVLPISLLDEFSLRISCIPKLKKKKSNHTTLLVTSSWSRIPLRNSLEFGCHLPGAMCMEVWGAGVGGGGQGLVVAGAGWGGEHRSRWGGGGAGPWSVQAGGKMNNSPHVRTSPRTEWREVWVRL